MSSVELPVENAIKFDTFLANSRGNPALINPFTITHKVRIEENLSLIQTRLKINNRNGPFRYVRIYCNRAWINFDDDNNIVHYTQDFQNGFSVTSGSDDIINYFRTTNKVKWLLAYLRIYSPEGDSDSVAFVRADMLSVRNTWGETFKQENILEDENIGTSFDTIPSQYLGESIYRDFSHTLPNPVISRDHLSNTFSILAVDISTISNSQITFSIPLNRVNAIRDEINIYLLNDSNEKYEFVRSINIKDDNDGVITADFSEFADKKIQLTRFITMGLSVRFETNPIDIDFATGEVSMIFVSPDELERIKINSSTPAGVYSPILLYNPVDDKERCVL